MAGYRLHVGIREIRVTDDGLLLVNGHRVKLFGANIHEERAARGPALTPANRELDLALLPQARRHAHAGPLSAPPPPPRAGRPPGRDGLGARCRSLAQGYKAFETPGVTDKGSRLHQGHGRSRPEPPLGADLEHRKRDRARLAAARRLHPRRGAAAAPDRPDAACARSHLRLAPAAPSTYRVLDALGVNCYFGWYPGPGRPDRRPPCSGRSWTRSTATTRMAMFVTEFGAEANRDGPFDEKGTYSFQRQLVGITWPSTTRRAFVNGALVWALRDFRVAARLGRRQPEAAAAGEPEGTHGERGTRSRPSPTIARLTSRARRGAQALLRRQPVDRPGERDGVHAAARVLAERDSCGTRTRTAPAAADAAGCQARAAHVASQRSPYT